ncbi:MAG: YidC/Oxa1 family membrane protein insertase [Eubacteriales bacterium]
MNIFENILELVYYPIAMLLKLCYMLVGNYGWAIIIFAIIAKVLLFPLSIKTEKSRLQQQKLQPKLEELKRRYKNDPRNPKYNEQLQELYHKEGVSQSAGCLPTLIQFPIIFGLWNAIRRPLWYISGLGIQTITAITTVFYNSGIESIVKALSDKIENLTESWIKINEIVIAQTMHDKANFELVKDLLPENFEPVNMNFLGLELGAKPSDYGLWSWFIILPIICGITSFLASWITTKINTPKNQKQPAVPGMNAMLYTMPIISMIFAYSFNVGVCIYLIVSNLLSIAQVFILKLVVKPEKEEKKQVKEKKLNYNQIDKIKREQAAKPSEVIVVDENADSDNK